MNYQKFKSHVKLHFLKFQPDLFHYQKEMSQKPKVSGQMFLLEEHQNQPIKSGQQNVWIEI